MGHKNIILLYLFFSFYRNKNTKYGYKCFIQLKNDKRCIDYLNDKFAQLFLNEQKLISTFLTFENTQ